MLDLPDLHGRRFAVLSTASKTCSTSFFDVFICPTIGIHFPSAATNTSVRRHGSVDRVPGLIADVQLPPSETSGAGTPRAAGPLHRGVLDQVVRTCVPAKAGSSNLGRRSFARRWF